MWTLLAIVFLAVAVPLIVAAQVGKEAVWWSVKQIAIALDQLANAFLAGWADETLSSRAWRWEKDGIRAWPRKLIDWLAARLGDANHCHESYLSERRGAQLPPELRPGARR